MTFLCKYNALFSAELPDDEQRLIKNITNFLVFALVSELIVLELIHFQVLFVQYFVKNMYSMSCTVEK